MSDLIKREDAVSRTFCTSVSGVPRMVVLLDDIKALPSIDSKTKVVAQVTFDEDKLREIVHEAVEQIKEEYDIVDRPKGAWEVVYKAAISIPSNWNKIDNLEPIYRIKLKCPFCGFQKDFVDGHTAQYNFCPQCGADMRQTGGEDNE